MEAMLQAKAHFKVHSALMQGTYKAGDLIQKGDPIGMFHYGGSTHVLIFNKRAADKLTFYTELNDGKGFYNTSPNINATNVPVLAQIAKYDGAKV